MYMLAMRCSLPACALRAAAASTARDGSQQTAATARSATLRQPFTVACIPLSANRRVLSSSSCSSVPFPRLAPSFVGLRPRPSRVIAVAAVSADDVPQAAVEGDIVTIHYVCRDETGEVLESSLDSHPEGLSFEIGAGDVTGNPFFQGFDAAVRGLSVGQAAQLEASGGEWQKELVFTIPRDHEEIQRLDNRYKNQGGVKEGAILELANGAKALILKVLPDKVTLDANNMLAGKKLLIDIDLIDISKFSG